MGLNSMNNTLEALTQHSEAGDDYLDENGTGYADQFHEDEDMEDMDEE
eukprot:CAMPEP_0197056004 /NCGR_PEP_ID=MMETSP1384-20130603/77262_1 /TAXON_ID=29189 /ORGANISM="Ammonia sp." /LENGTH=47 /DNA_ID= /DNA_START= /DNA_END= /DNA_ORIENTATION=